MGFRGSLSLPIRSVNVRALPRLRRGTRSSNSAIFRDLVEWGAHEQPVLLSGRAPAGGDLPVGERAAGVRGSGRHPVGVPGGARDLRGHLLAGAVPSPAPPGTGPVP